MNFLPPAVNTVLLARLSETSTAVEFIHGQDVERLVAVTWEGAYEGAVQSWAACGRDLSQLHLISIGTRMRGSAMTEPIPLVNGLPIERLDELPTKIEHILHTRSGQQQAVLVDGIVRMFEQGGIDRTYAIIEQLVAATDSMDVLCLIALPGTAPEGVASGLAHCFECVLEEFEPGSTPTMQPAGRLGGLPTEDIFELLVPPRRRVLLRVLDSLGEAVPVDQLARSVAAQPIEAAYADAPERLTTALYQIDLPKFAEHDVVTFDPDEATASIRLNALQLWPFIELSRRMEGV